MFTEEEQQQLRRERFEHPHPRVQLRMEVLWLIGCGESYSSSARLADVSGATVDRSVALYRAGGIDGLKQFDWQGPTSELAAHQTSLEEEFRSSPPHTTAEAARRMEEVTGVKRGLTPVRHFLKKSLGLKWRCTAAIPLPPKKLWRSMWRLKRSSVVKHWTRCSKRRDPAMVTSSSLPPPTSCRERFCAACGARAACSFAAERKRCQGAPAKAGESCE